MKTKWSIYVVLLALAASSALADEEKKANMAMKPYKGSAEFERIKSLAGKWLGTMDGQKMDLEYTIVAGGSAVMERTFVGTPMEMVTLYNDKAGKLALTHYCMLHNRPHLLLTDSDENSVSLKLDENGEIDAKKESHMNALVLTFVSDDEIEQKWTHVINGEAQEAHAIKFKRVKKKAKDPQTTKTKR